MRCASAGGAGISSRLSAERTLVGYEVELEVALSVPGGFLAERALSGPARTWLIEQPAESCASTSSGWPGRVDRAVHVVR